MNPLVSIVVCTYNRAVMLQKTMETIFAQHYRPVEIVVVDDGSTDDTEKLISSYGDKVRYYRKKNEGISATRTIGCQLAKGEYIAFQDDDDLMPPDRIVNLYDALQRYPFATLALGDWAIIDNNGNLTGEKSRFSILLDNNITIKKPLLIKDGYAAILWPKITPGPPTTLFRRIDGERITWFDPRFFHSCEDTDFFARLGQLGPIVYLPEIVCYYRKGHSSLIKNNLLTAYSRLLLFEKHLISLNPEQKDLKKRLQDRMLSILKQIAFFHSNDIKPIDSDYGDILKRGLSQLDVKGRLAYRLYTIARLTIRKFIKG
jgi:glycosyltransferase involved in cell wall biosynthesis